VVTSVHHVICKGTSDLRKRDPGVRQLALVVALVMVAGGPVVWAQTNASIQGTVTGPSNATLQGVEIKVTGEQGSWTALTDQKGFYLIPSLSPGSYQLTASLEPFAPREVENIQLGLDQTLTLNITLESLAFSDEVVVTSQKRTETLLEIPMSITALSGETMEQQRVEEFLDFVPLVPGLSVVTSTPGQTRITLRGINTGGIASTVGVYVDEVPFGSSSGLANGAILAGEFDTFDVARIEVLRGPQGTLYGASSLAGVFKYVMNEPSTEGVEARLLGSLETVADGDLGYSLKGMVNLPVSDQWAVRASGFFRFDDGFIDSIGNNPIPSLTTPGVNVVDGTLVEEGLNTIDTYGGRFAALFRPSDEFSLTLAAQIQQIESGAPSEVDADPVTFEPLYGGMVQSRYQANPVDTTYQIYSATIDWDLGATSLVSVTSYGTFEQDLRLDAAYTMALTPGIPLASFLTYLLGNDLTNPLSAVLPQTTSTDKFTQELRLVSANNDSFEWLVGGYYTDEESSIAQQIVALTANTEDPAPGIPILADLLLPSTYEEFALFADATWHVTPRFHLSFGGRGSWNDQTATQTGEGPLIGTVSYPEASSSESPFTYSFSPRYELASNSSVYLRIASGFRPGGPNVLPPGVPEDTPLTYDSDSLTSYEVGWKVSGSGGTYSLDLAAFYLDWQDIQLLTVVNGFGINANGGTAVSKGGEFSFSVIPTAGLTLSLNGAYTDAYLTEDTDPILVGGVDGDPLPYVPDWTFGLMADYDWVVGGEWTMYVGGILAYTDERAYGFDDRTADGGLNTVDDYMTLNLRAAAYVGRWTFELYGKNLTDEMGIAAVDATGLNLPNGAYGLSLIRPRTIGVSVGLRFWGS
jgi:iron complex outermembrane recepter protein